jgi:hypothetical protein
MAIQLEDGTLLIQGAVDGFSIPLLGVKKVQSVIDPFQPTVKASPNLMQHVIEHGRPATQQAADRQEVIKQLIKEMQTKTPNMTFAQAWNILQQKRPELFQGD